MEREVNRKKVIPEAITITPMSCRPGGTKGAMKMRNIAVRAHMSTSSMIGSGQSGPIQISGSPDWDNRAQKQLPRRPKKRKGGCRRRDGGEEEISTDIIRVGGGVMEEWGGKKDGVLGGETGGGVSILGE